MFNSPEEIYYSVIVGVLLMVFLATIFIMSIVRYQNKLQKHQQEKVDLQNQFAKVLLQSQLEIQEQTLQYVAHELHDNIGQIASLIKINLNTIQPEDVGSTKEKLEGTKVLLRQLITDLKLLSINLSGNRITEIGLINALELEITRLNKTELYHAVMHVNDMTIQLDDQKTIILFRMAQETINNIIKHSAANEITVSIQLKENLLILTLIDNGIGFDHQQAALKGGFGLKNLKNRAKLIDATFSIESKTNQGTIITIETPL